MRTIAIANHKGGVGKTATAHALGAALSLTRRVLLVDTDPQASLSAACGVRDAAGHSLAEVLGGAEPGTLPLRDAIRPITDTLALVPADIALATTELALVSRMGRENALRRALTTLRGYDVCVIDCPPSLSLLTVNALAAADGVLVPTMPQAADLRGLGLFLATVSQLREQVNPGLELLGVLVTCLDARLLHHQEALDALRGAGLPLFDTTIGRSVRVAEAAGAGESVITFEPHNPRALEYRALAQQEVATWLNDGLH